VRSCRVLFLGQKPMAGRCGAMCKASKQRGSSLGKCSGLSTRARPTTAVALSLLSPPPCHSYSVRHENYFCLSSPCPVSSALLDRRSFVHPSALNVPSYIAKYRNIAISQYRSGLDFDNDISPLIACPNPSAQRFQGENTAAIAP
jgi:hypothetical protein